MTCQITSAWKAGPGPIVIVQTDVDPGVSDATNLDTHLDEVATSPGVQNGTTITTTWPGAPAGGVSTDRRPDESFSSWQSRHKTRCLAALTADPIDCP